METKEAQNQSQIDEYRRKGPVTFGPWTSHIWRSDPRHLLFLLARYKFCAKLLSNRKTVLEVGCGDGAGLPIMLQAVEKVYALDFEPLVLQDAQKRFAQEGLTRCEFAVHDLTAAPYGQTGLAGAYCLDVIEHIPAEREGLFVDNICASLSPEATLIIGTPNRSAAAHASAASQAGHINLKSAPELTALLSVRFENVFVFSMNDEVVHTGFHPMAHYLLAVGCGLKRGRNAAPAGCQK